MMLIVLRRRLAESALLAFPVLWALVFVLQLLDVGSVWLDSLAGAHTAEYNPVILRLIARYGLLGAMAVKFGAVALLLVLAAALWTLGARSGWRAVQLVCVVFLALAAVGSAVIVWQDAAAAVFAH